MHHFRVYTNNVRKLLPYYLVVDSFVNSTSAVDFAFGKRKSEQLFGDHIYLTKPRSLTGSNRAPQTQRPRTSRGSTSSATTAANNAALLAAAQAAGMPASALDPSDPMSSMNALLAAAQVSLLIFPTLLCDKISKYYVTHLSHVGKFYLPTYQPAKLKRNLIRYFWRLGATSVFSILVGYPLQY